MIIAGKAGPIMSSADITRKISHRTLKNEQGRVFRELLADGEAVAISTRGRVDGVLITPAMLAEMRSHTGEAERLRAALPLLLAAARAGVAVPSVTFETLGLPVAEDWRALNALVAALPMRLTHDPEGQPLPAQPATLSLQHASEDEDELVL